MQTPCRGRIQALPPEALGSECVLGLEELVFSLNLCKIFYIPFPLMWHIENCFQKQKPVKILPIIMPWIVDYWHNVWIYVKLRAAKVHCLVRNGWSQCKGQANQHQVCCRLSLQNKLTLILNQRIETCRGGVDLDMKIFLFVCQNF